MNELALLSAVVNPLWAAGAFFLAWGCLRLLDLAMGFSFKGWITNATDNAVATYLGFRILAVCILVGLIVRPPV